MKGGDKLKNKSLTAKSNRDLHIASVIFLLPVMILLTVYIFYPIIQTFNISLYKWNGISVDKDFIGITNWVTLMSDKIFWQAFKNNIIVMILSIAIQIPMGVALATFMEFANKKFSGVFKVIWFIPMLMSSTAIGFLFSYAFAANGGIISAISQALGGGMIDILGNPDTVLYALIGIICWQFVPFYMVYSMAAYTNISVEVYESAIIDGANKVQYFRSIALPLLIPSIRNAMILSMVGALKYFDLIFVMTGGGPDHASELMATYMYSLSFAEFNMGYGSTVAGGMFILISLMAIFTMKVVSKIGEEKEA